MAYRHKYSATVWCDSCTQPRDAARMALEWVAETITMLESESGRDVELACDADELEKQAESCAKQGGGVVVRAEWDEGAQLKAWAETAGQ